MTEKKWAGIFLCLNLVLINGAILGVLNLRYPLVGHDYILGLPSLLDTAIHYRLNGLSIQWFTPSFGGGIPAYPNPNNMQYSIPALLAVILPPWQAIMLTVVIQVSIGFLLCYYFFSQSLKMHWTSSMLGAVFFSANGFIVSRVAPGHLGYFAFPLLGIFLITLFDSSIPIKISGPLLGLTTGIFIHSAGYFILIIFGLSILITAPLLYIYNHQLVNWKRLLVVTGCGAVIGLAIALSKLTASFALMQNFQRHIADNYPVSFISGLFGFILQFLAVMTLFPAFALGGLNPDDIPPFLRVFTGAQYGIWEMDASITPIVFIILVIFTIRFIHEFKNNLSKISRANRIAFALFIFFAWVGIEFTLARGFIYPVLRNLPILNSLRANVRFAAMFIFPIILLATIIYHNWLQTWSRERIWTIFILANLTALLPLSFYFMFKTDIYWQIFDIAVPQKIYSELASGESFEVTAIGQTKGYNPGALLARVSNLNLYEPLFGPELQDFHPQITEGSIWKISDGYYNLTNPISLMYPEQNNLQPFERFRLADKANMELFAKHIQPNWNLPTYQRMTDWISGLAFIVTSMYLIIQSFRRRRPGIKI